MSWTKQSIDDVKRAARLEDIIGAQTKLTREGARMLGCCPLPGHDDGTPSLDVNVGQQVWVCRGCSGMPGGDVIRFVELMHGLSFADAVRRLSEHTGVALVDERSLPTAPRRRVAAWKYTDEKGSHLYSIERWEPAKDGRRKDFLQVQADGVTYKKHPRQVLYRLPEVLAAVAAGDTVYVCEGEKAADAVVALGLCATTHAGGASIVEKAWTASLAEPLAGATVVLLPDNDGAGHKAMATIAQALKGVARSVVEVRLPGLVDKGDAVEWIEAGGTRTALEEMAAKSAPSMPMAMPPSGPNPLTDSGNAERWVRMHGHRFRFDLSTARWLSWDGARWLDGGDGPAMLATKEVARSYLAEVADNTDSKRRVELVKHANASESAAARKAMIALAKSEPSIAVAAAALDADPWLLNVQNGTIDLRTGERRPHSILDLLTKMAPVMHDAKATAPTWEAFLASSVPDEGVREFLQRFVGYACTGIISEHVLPFFHGNGGNGKGTFVETVAGVLGDYASPVRSDLLLEQKNDQHPTELADLRGRRFTFASEPKKGRALNEDQVKLITGGDTIKARFMRQDFFEFRPTHKMCVLTNSVPVIKGTDAGIWRRVRLVPWTVTPKTPNTGLMAELERERAGILNWAISGCLSWQKHGLGTAGAVDAATEELRANSDILGDFLAARVVKTAPDTRLSASALFREYRTWAEARGERPWTMTAFGRAMTERWPGKMRIGGAVVYLGIGLRFHDSQDTAGQLSVSPAITKTHESGTAGTVQTVLFDGNHDGHSETSDDDETEWGNW